MQSSVKRVMFQKKGTHMHTHATIKINAEIQVFGPSVFSAYCLEWMQVFVVWKQSDWQFGRAIIVNDGPSSG